MSLLDHFQNFVQQEGLIQEGDRILLALSGGVDSMVMAHLFLRAKIEFGGAHCNFRLREDESDQDEAFLRAWAQSHELPFYCTSFDTTDLARQSQTSVQVLARELRYDWLEKIRISYSFTTIATAHHLNDSIETFLYNFTKGSGLAGLRGIPLRNGGVIRPLLFAKKEDILAYAKQENIPFREDSSNATDKYARNQIRHHVIPALQKINPAFEQTAARNFSILNETFQLFRDSVERFKAQWVEERDAQLIVQKKGLLLHPHTQHTLLFEAIRQGGFHFHQIQKILQHLAEGRVGALFYTSSHRLLVDREVLVMDLLRKVEDTSDTIRISQETQRVALSEGMLIFERKQGRPAFFASPDRAAYLDADLIQYPLQLRRWNPGDVFCPLGMQGKHQKLQDFFSNNGLSRFEKEKIWVLVDADDNILWIVGYRLDERFRIRTTTTSFLEITYIKDDL